MVVKGVEMHLLLFGALAVAAPVLGAGLFSLQASLEEWDQRRHAED